MKFDTVGRRPGLRRLGEAGSEVQSFEGLHRGSCCREADHLEGDYFVCRRVRRIIRRLDGEERRVVTSHDPFSLH